jgi:hypothetical protein
MEGTMKTLKTMCAFLVAVFMVVNVSALRIDTPEAKDLVSKHNDTLSPLGLSIWWDVELKNDKLVMTWYCDDILLDVTFDATNSMFTVNSENADIVKGLRENGIQLDTKYDRLKLPKMNFKVNFMELNECQSPEVIIHNKMTLEELLKTLKDSVLYY